PHGYSLARPTQDLPAQRSLFPSIVRHQTILSPPIQRTIAPHAFPAYKPTVASCYRCLSPNRDQPRVVDPERLHSGCQGQEHLPPSKTLRQSRVPDRHSRRLYSRCKTRSIQSLCPRGVIYSLGKTQIKAARVTNTAVSPANAPWLSCVCRRILITSNNCNENNSGETNQHPVLTCRVKDLVLAEIPSAARDGFAFFARFSGHFDKGQVKTFLMRFDRPSFVKCRPL